MFQGTIVLIALGYLGLLFAIASYGDRLVLRRAQRTHAALIYALSLGVYCTSWTFFGSVGLSARSGFAFLPIYIGPILVFTLGWPLLQRIVAISKRHNITSIADFISARYGKNQSLGALVAVIAVIGVIPYISLQLKAIALALQTMLPVPRPGMMQSIGPADYLALLVAAALAVFASLFGTRHIDTTEHQHGMILAIAVESIVKLFAFLFVGTFVTFSLMGGIGAMLERIAERPDIAQVFSGNVDWVRWTVMIVLSMAAIVLLPRQFHVTVVENHQIADVKRAAWLFPAYLAAINIFVVPIAAAGLLTFGASAVDADSFVLALPVAAGSKLFALLAFIGGLSAATAMVIVEAVALSIMLCNNVVLPIILHRQTGSGAAGDMGRTLITIRRAAIGCILALAFVYYEAIGSSAALAQIGLISFAAIAQFAPAFFGGLFWRRATAAGAMAGITAGFALWAYTLFLPSFADAGWLGAAFTEGLWGVDLLKPRRLFGFDLDPLTHGALWSLGINCLAMAGVSLWRRPTTAEQVQASMFISHDSSPVHPSYRMWRSTVTMGELEATVARYLGAERARKSFKEHSEARGQAIEASAGADVRSLRFAEHLLASAVGAASSRLIMWLLIERSAPKMRGAVRLLDDASAAIQYNRDLLQSAIDHVKQGIAVFDKHLKLICWNQQFAALLELPGELERVGTPLHEVVEAIESRCQSPGAALSAIEEKVRRIAIHQQPYQERFNEPLRIVEVHSARMPDAGVAVTFADVTERVLAAEALEARVAERTAELTRVNGELSLAKAQADEANLGKTRFIAAASHDILQPLNAARLFASSLVARQRNGKDSQLVRNLDSSLEAVEEILTTLLDISRLDAGALKPEVSSFAIGELIETLALEHEPAAREKGLRLKRVHCGLNVATDRRLLRRVLQNLLSNAIKYTAAGGIVIGCRRRGKEVVIEVHDSGRGIPEEKLAVIFREFERLDAHRSNIPGLGLGLSIVERIAQMMQHDITVRSIPGRGTMISIAVPAAPAAAETGPVRARRAAHVPTLGHCRALVVDNEPAILDGMKTLLEGWGCTVQTACSAAEALAISARGENRFDIIIADYHLGEDDGLSLVEHLRKLMGRQVPALLITADRSSAVVQAARRKQVVHMKKPIKPASLRAAMSHVLARMEAAE